MVFLKKYQGDPPTDIVHPPYIKHGQVLPEPATIVRSCLNRGVWELMVQWVRRRAADVTWETLESFRQQYLEFQLEDKLFCQAGVNR